MNSHSTINSCPAEASLDTTTQDRPSLYRRLVLSAFARLPLGELRVQIPNGQIHLYGALRHKACTSVALAPSNGRQPSSHPLLRIHSERFFAKCVLQGDIGFAESYLDGDWSTPDLPALLGWFLLNHEATPTLSGARTRQFGLNLLRLANRLGQFLRRNTPSCASRNIREHYDLSNEFFALWLDESMMYSSALWRKKDDTLAEAQVAKNEELCRKLQLRPGLHVLEIGSGWGGWAIHAARKYHCRITSLTLSPAQKELACKRVKEAGLDHLIEIRLQDYRQLPAHERFDRIVSIEMLEAVGHAYLPEWSRVVGRALKPEGLLALQFITCADARYRELRRGVDFIQKHVFPGSLLLSLNRVNEQLTKHGNFVLHHLDDLGQDYARTLACWRERFHACSESVRALGFDERFLRKWDYYLAYCETAFAYRHISVVQTVHTRPDNLALT